MGLVGPYRLRLGGLQHLTLRLVARRIWIMKTLDSLLGCWPLSYQFRRPLYAIFHLIYHIDEPPTRMFKLDRLCINELMLAAVWGLALLATFGPDMIISCCAVMRH